ncbi:MAG: hypothetical protein U0931_06985 [Vulcanimicrobiota bacterium]
MAIPLLGSVAGLNPLPTFNPYPGLSPLPGQAPEGTMGGSLFAERLQMMQQLQWLEPLLELLGSMLNSPSVQPYQPTPFTQAPAFAPAPAAGVSGPVAPAPAAAPAAAAPVQAGHPAAGGQTPRPGQIGPGNRVLVIGDSHTAGLYGDELDRQLRARGAQVHTVGSSGASASNFINGRGTTVGYADHGMDGHTQKTASHATPRLEDLINQDKPDVIVVNLGANFRGASQAGIEGQVRSLGEVAKRHGIPIKWVGPPKPAHPNMEAVQRFDQQLAAAVAPYGEYISSVPYTPEYAGADGLHYSGTRGRQLAQQWAQGIASNL